MENTEKTDLEKLNDLLKKIKPIKEEYDKKREKELFNIFSALHRIDDEVRLHSRFISYLLSPISNHRQKNLFAKIFVEEILKVKDFDFENYEVYPNEFNKSEYKEIDILLVDKNKKAIIIENKTRYSTPDSNYRDKPNGYNGQLERYYNTIHKGKDVNESNAIHCENPYVFYLSPNGKLPNETSLGMLKEKNIVKCIHYETDIVKWIGECVKKTEADKVLRSILEQYQNIVKVMTRTDIDTVEKIGLRNTISEDYETVMYLMNNFNHIKWHTIDEFWLELKNKLDEKEYKKVYLSENYIDNLNVLAHEKNKEYCNISISFELDDNSVMYVCYDKQGLTFGNVTLNKWKKFSNPEIQEINFIDFKNEETFSLINKSNMNTIIDTIIKEIKKEISANFENMKKPINL